MWRWRSPAAPAALAVLFALALIACSRDGNGAATAQEPNGGVESRLPVVVFATAGGGGATMAVEVADTEELRSCGLMHRLSLPENQGMLFVFESDYVGGFWNRNTFVPLTLAWIRSDGIVAGLTDMDPVRPEDNPQVNITYPAPAPVRYVIEANRGWFARNGIAMGDRADLSDALARGSEGTVPICREKGY